MRVQIIYDQSCPFCSDFVKVVELRSAGFEVELISARSTDCILVNEVSSRHNLDDGMVVIIGDIEYFGDAAAHQLSKLTRTKILRGKLYKLMLRNRKIAKLTYPILVLLRKLYFRLVRKKLINDDV